MRCIFCLQERPGSEEHVFPLAIGGTLTTHRVCQVCNSNLGARVDAALIDHFTIRIRRGQLGLAGRGEAPNQFEILTGVSQLADGSGRLHVSFNSATGKLDLRVLHRAVDVELPDGRKVRQITIDANDIDEVPKIIRRERKRHNLPPLSDEELAVEVAKATQNVRTVEQPAVTKTFSVSFRFLRHAVIKIAYELAFLWLGESYLDDPMAVQLREAICKDDIHSTDAIPGYFGDAGTCPVFKHWTASPSEHRAIAVCQNDAIALAVQIFDIFTAVVPVSAGAKNYLSGPEGRSKLKFLALESTTGKLHVSSVGEELARIAKLWVEVGRMHRVPSPVFTPTNLTVNQADDGPAGATN